METTNKALTIYKASAGSGKTFTLSVEYIKLLIKNPSKFRSILAVTFTNKATEEMKTRILSQLYGIWKRLPDSQGYMNRLKKELHLGEDVIAERAGIALRGIVHNYSYFRIETIDSFFQSVLRNLARELYLTANLRIELNDKDIESIAVDDLIDGLEENDDLLKWILEYIRDNIEEEKKWNVIEDIKKFGLNIFKDFYKTNSNTLNDAVQKENFFKDYTSTLYKVRNDAENKIQDCAREFFGILEEHGIDVADFKYGDKGVASYFLKIRKGIYNDSKLLTDRVRNAINEPDASHWITKKATTALTELVQNTLVPMLDKAERVRSENWRMYQSSVLTLRHLNQLRLLNSIEKKVRETNAETNRFLLSDTHSLLHSLIKDTDSPFVFEKIGSHLENIMIDEFQDTSVIQWLNFKVLLEECMSHGEEQGNLIVGDVKQSIYRWRSGDWRLLNNIEGQFPVMRDMLKIETLDTNYRSQQNIVNFNNQFFKIAAEYEYHNQLECEDGRGESGAVLSSAGQLKKAYSDVVQKVSEKNNTTQGLVNLKMLSCDSTQEQMLECVAETIERLLKEGVKQADIAIIVRTNDKIQLIAKYLSNALQGLRLVSDEAFQLGNSVAVTIIVSAIYTLFHDDDLLAKAFLVKSYCTQVLGEDAEVVNDRMAQSECIDEALPKEYTNLREELISLPIFDLAERIYRMFSLERIEGEDAYVFAFYDLLSDYLTNTTMDIDSFIQDWNSSLYKKAVHISGINGIRLITIHKSKGLEFEHVIIPFCDWKLDKADTIWCTPTVAPFNKLPLVPIDMSAIQVKGTIYEDDYIEENLQSRVDNLNLLYVAFTRATSSLTVIAQRCKNDSSRSAIIEKAIMDMDLDGAVIEGDVADVKQPLTFTYGELSVQEKNEDKISKNIFMPRAVNVDIPFRSYESNTEFKQSNKSREFVCDDEDTNLSYIKTGRILHYLFSSINTVDDMDESIENLEMNGLLAESGMEKEDIHNMLQNRFKDKQVAEWFSGKWELFNECNILSVDENTGEVIEQRPDRVMKNGDEIVIVDFKFGSPKPEYQKQVHEYISVIREMGYENVRGYLWFVYSNKIEEIR